MLGRRPSTKPSAIGAFALANALKPKRAENVMRVVAPPAQIGKQRVGDVDCARPLGPSDARE